MNDDIGITKVCLYALVIFFNFNKRKEQKSGLAQLTRVIIRYVVKIWRGSCCWWWKQGSCMWLCSKGIVRNPLLFRGIIILQSMSVETSFCETALAFWALFAMWWHLGIFSSHKTPSLIIYNKWKLRNWSNYKQIIVHLIAWVFVFNIIS